MHGLIDALDHARARGQPGLDGISAALAVGFGEATKVERAAAATVSDNQTSKKAKVKRQK